MFGLHKYKLPFVLQNQKMRYRMLLPIHHLLIHIQDKKVRTHPLLSKYYKIMLVEVLVLNNLHNLYMLLRLLR